MVDPPKKQTGKKSPSRSSSPTVVDILTQIQKLDKTNDILDNKPVNEDDVLKHSLKTYTEKVKELEKLVEGKEKVGEEQKNEIEALTEKVQKLQLENKRLVEKNKALEATNQRFEEKNREEAAFYLEWGSKMQKFSEKIFLSTSRPKNPSNGASNKNVSNHSDDNNSANSEESLEKRLRSSSRDSVKKDDEECQPSTSGWTGKN